MGRTRESSEDDQHWQQLGSARPRVKLSASLTKPDDSMITKEAADHDSVGGMREVYEWAECLATFLICTLSANAEYIRERAEDGPKPDNPEVQYQIWRYLPGKVKKVSSARDALYSERGPPSACVLEWCPLQAWSVFTGDPATVTAPWL